MARRPVRTQPGAFSHVFGLYAHVRVVDWPVVRGLYVRVCRCVWDKGAPLAGAGVVGA